MRQHTHDSACSVANAQQEYLAIKKKHILNTTRLYNEHDFSQGLAPTIVKDPISGNSEMSAKAGPILLMAEAHTISRHSAVQPYNPIASSAQHDTLFAL